MSGLKHSGETTWRGDVRGEEGKGEGTGGGEQD
jgi:hypothetical protein